MRRRGTASTRRLRKPLRQIQRLLSLDLDGARQGLALVEAMDDPAILDDLLTGIAIAPGGALTIAPSSRHRRHLKNRETRLWVALSLLRTAGRLERAEALDLLEHYDLRSEALEPLDGLPGLRALALSGRRPEALAALAALPALERLEVRHSHPGALAAIRVACAGLRALTVDLHHRAELSHLAASGSAGSALSGLERLSLGRGSWLEDLSPLAALPALRRLEIEGGSDQLDLRTASGLTGLESLRLTRCASLLSDLSPLAALPALRRLEIEMPRDGASALRGTFDGREAVLAALGAAP